MTFNGVLCVVNVLLYFAEVQTTTNATKEAYTKGD
jgi:hypothetical protein